MLNDNHYLKKIISQLSPIEINRSLDKETLFNTICSIFPSDGTNLLYLTDSENDAWIYFANNTAVAASFSDLSGEEALLEILKIEYGAVNCARHVEIPKFQFSYSLQDFMKLVKSDKIDDEKKLDLSHLTEIPHCKGFAVLEGNRITLKHNVVPDALPIEYLKKLRTIMPDSKGTCCKLKQYETSENFYTLVYKEKTWIFTFDKMVNKAKTYHYVLEALNKTYG